MELGIKLKQPVTYRPKHLLQISQKWECWGRWVTSLTEEGWGRSHVLWGRSLFLWEKPGLWYPANPIGTTGSGRYCYTLQGPRIFNEENKSYSAGLWSYWVGQNVCSVFSGRWYGKIQTKFLANPLQSALCVLAANVEQAPALLSPLSPSSLWALFSTYPT